MRRPEYRHTIWNLEPVPLKPESCHRGPAFRYTFTTTAPSANSASSLRALCVPAFRHGTRLTRTMEPQMKLARAILLFALTCAPLHAETPQTALAAALHGTDGSGLVLDWRTGAVLARIGEDTRATPGSAVKPLLLEWALQHNVIRAETTVYCRRNLHIGTRELRCSHPADEPMIDAERALAESCNTWFAELGKRFTPAQLNEALEAAHLRHGNITTLDQRELATLGLENITATPSELANAYRAMLLPLKPGDTVVSGMRDSVRFGMAHGADVHGITLLGKTGTAGEPGQRSTHGWFAGAVPGRYVLVLFVPHGDGGIASGLARKFIEATR